MFISYSRILIFASPQKHGTVVNCDSKGSLWWNEHLNHKSICDELLVMMHHQNQVIEGAGRHWLKMTRSHVFLSSYSRGSQKRQTVEQWKRKGEQIIVAPNNRRTKQTMYKAASINRQSTVNYASRVLHDKYDGYSLVPRISILLTLQVKQCA
jgi:hypothetical protein